MLTLYPRIFPIALLRRMLDGHLLTKDEPIRSGRLAFQVLGVISSQVGDRRYKLHSDLPLTLLGLLCLVLQPSHNSLCLVPTARAFSSTAVRKFLWQIHPDSPCSQAHSLFFIHAHTRVVSFQKCCVHPLCFYILKKLFCLFDRCF